MEGKRGIYIVSFLYYIQEKLVGKQLELWRSNGRMFDEAKVWAPASNPIKHW